MLDHAEGRFVVDKWARAAVLPLTETCTFVEAARQCNVGQTVTRDIMEQRGLIDRRQRLRGVPFRIPEAEIAAIEESLRSSVDLVGVKAMLCTSHAVVMGLIESSLLTPFLKGSRRTKHDHEFLARDVRALLDRLGGRLPIQGQPAEGQTLLTNADHGYAVPLAYPCRQAWDGHLPLAGRLIDVTGRPGFLVQRHDALVARRKHRSSFPAAGGRDPPERE